MPYSQKFLFSFLFFSFVITTVNAQHNWIRTNPGGGGALSMVGATKSGLIVAGSDLSGLYTTSNNGASWNVSGITQGLTQTHVTSFGFHPTDGNTFIIGTGIGAFKSTDGGVTLYPVTMETSPFLGLGFVESIGMAISNNQVGYMAHYEYWLPELSFLKTTDAGETWGIVTTSGLPDTARVTKILVDANNADIVYALTGKARFGCADPYLYRSIDGGQNWTRIFTTIGPVLDFDLHPTDPTIIYASNFEIHPDACNAEMWQYANGIGETYKSTDGGSTSNPIFSSMSGVINVGTNPDHISVVDIIWDTGTWKTTDGGTSWTNSGPRSGWTKGWSDEGFSYATSFYGYAKTLTKDRFNPSKMYGSFGQWAWSTLDAGDHIVNISTTEVTTDHYLSTGLENVEANWIDVNDSDPNSIYLGAYDLGFWYSKNHGASWKRSLPDNTVYPDYSWWAGGGSNCNFVLSDPDDASIVWASFSAQQPDTESAIFKSTNSGENWVLSNTGLNNFGLTTHGLSIDIQSNMTARTLFVTQEGDVWKSVDGGVSWSEIYENGGLKFTEVDKFDSQIIYAGGENGFFRSMDGGTTWDDKGLPEMSFSTTVANAVMRPDIIPERDDLYGAIPIIAWQGVFEIKADLNVANRVYVVAHGPSKGLYRSDDAGTTWSKLYTNDKMRGVAIAPGNSNIVYASSSTNYHSGEQSNASIGILVSYDAGSTWAFANDGMAWTNGGRMEVESGATPHIWAWVPGTGLQYALVPNFVLPVTILSPFTARLQDDAVFLKWETSAEIQNEGFEIARSSDGIHWTTLQFVTPKSNKKYQAVDHDPLHGISYYKLTQKDLDGRNHHLGTVTVQYSPKQPPTIFPNPTSDVVHVTFPDGPNHQDIELQVFDQLGRLLLAQKGSNELNVKVLSKGIYRLGILVDGAIYWEELVLE